MIKALVVDDDEDLLDMVTLMLQASDMEVVTLSGGSRFFETMKTEQPDIVILDIFLGDSDGRILCKKLKESKEFGTIPVILYSAANITQDMIEEACAEHFMAKPFEMDVLVNCIRDLAA